MFTRFLRALSLLCLSLVPLGLSAQLVSTNYVFSQATAPYTPITGGTVLNTGTAANQIYTVLLPFSFTFNGLGYTALTAHTNGFVTFGGTNPATTLTLPISSTTAYNGCVSALGRTLQGNAGGEMRWEVLGTAPNQVFVLQWNDWRRNAQTGDNFNFQIRLHESGVIETTYGNFVCSATTAQSTQVGLRGGVNTDYNNRLITNGTHTWNTSAAGIANNSISQLLDVFVPASGLVFRWSPSNVQVSNISYTPNTNQCTGTPRTVQATITDPNGVTSAQVNWTVNGVAQTPVAMTLVSGTAQNGVWEGTIPAAPGTNLLLVSFNITATDVNGVTSNASASTTYVDNYLGTNAGPDQTVSAGVPVTLSATANDPAIYSVLFSEITHFETGTGATAPYPAFIPVGAVDYDGIELANIHASNPADISGLQIVIWTSQTNSIVYTIPQGTIIPVGGVATFAYNNVASDPANLFFGMNVAPVPSSTSLYGYILRTASGAIVDVCATNSFVFPVASGITALQWQGNVTGMSGRAGMQRTGSDTNTASDWVVSNTPGPLQTVGTFNPGLNTVNTTPGQFVWTPGNLIGQQVVVGPFTPGTYTYTVSYSDGICTSTDDIVLTVPDCPAPTGAAVSNVEDSSVVVTWVSGGGAVTGTIIEYGPTGFTPGTGTQVAATTNPFTITGLTPNTNYQLFVIETCTGIGNSQPSNTVSFLTFCSPFPVVGNGQALAIVAPSLPFVDTISTVGGCYYNNSPLRVGPDVFYFFTVDSCATNVTVSLCGSSFDTWLYVRDATNTTTIANNNNFASCVPNTGSQVSFVPTPGASYYAILEGNLANTTGTFVINISQTTGVLNPTITTTSVNTACPVAATGSIVVNVTNQNGAGPVTYAWSTGETTSSINSLVAGNYTVTVSNGCGGTATASVNIISAYSVSSTQTNVSCNGGSNGAINLSVTGGGTPYAYVWSNAETTEDLANLLPGIYTVTVTETGACTATLSATITEPQPIALTLDSTFDASCNGGTDGGVFVSLTGGSTFQFGQTVTYTNPALALNNTFNFANVPTGAGGILIVTSRGDLDGTAGNLEQWTINDENGVALGTLGATGVFADQCAATPLVDTIFLSAAQIAAWAANGTVTFTGVASAAVSVTLCGAGQDFLSLELVMDVNFTYAWSNGANTEDIDSVAAGTYTLTATDGNGCVFTSNPFTVGEPAAIAVALDSTQGASCFNGTDGYLAISVSGGTAPYAFNWSNGATTEDLFGIGAGNYTGTITDANGCIFISAPINVSQPAALFVGLNGLTPVTCNGGSDGALDLNVTGGTAPYTFLWSNGATTEDLTGIPAGAYTGTITDGNGCVIVGGPVPMPQPSAISPSIVSITDVSCSGFTDGAINISVTGGNGGYTYTWSNGATTQDLSGVAAGDYFGTISDVNGCFVVAGPITVGDATPIVATVDALGNTTCAGDSTGFISVSVSGGTAPYTFVWSNGSTDEDLTAIPAGNYIASILDAVGCPALVGPIDITEPMEVFVVVDNLGTIACFGDSTGSIQVTPMGGTGTYTFAWSNGSTDEDLFDLPAGDYTGTITDANGCTLVAGPVNVSEAPELLLAVAIADVTCNGLADGAITLDLAGGTIPFVFSWSNGSTDEDLTGLAPGTYTGTITDGNGCVAVSPGLTINEPAPLGFSLVAVGNPSCAGNNDGLIQYLVSGGTAPYSYVGVQPTEQNLAPGNYGVTVTDANGCTITNGFTLTDPLAIVATATETPASGAAVADGAVDLTVSGGNGFYTYVWSNGETSEDLVNVLPGTYTVTVTDFFGCTATASQTVTFNVGIPVVGSDAQINLFPNPTNGQVTLSLALDKPQDVTVSLYTVTGQMVKALETRTLQSANWSLDLSEQPSGLYWVRVVIGEEVVTREIVKQ